MIELRLQERNPLPPDWVYGIAGRRFSSDTAMPELDAFRAPARRFSGPRTIDRGLPPNPPQAVFRGAAEIGPWRYSLDCSWNGRGFYLAVADLGRFAIGRGGQRITFERAPGAEDFTGLTEIVLGPSLILALALQGVWCLHASAIEIDGQALAFLGPSGIGKSTLARVLPELSGDRFRCAADDVLPVSLDAGGARALPRFPQLKYPPDRQPGSGVPSSLPLAAIYLLETEPSEPSSAGVTIEPVAGYQAVLSLVRHTHSARLFSQQLLRRHTESCAQLASQVPIRRLIYPREWQILPRVEEALRRSHGTRVPGAPGENGERKRRAEILPGRDSCLDSISP